MICGHTKKNRLDNLLHDTLRASDINATQIAKRTVRYKFLSLAMAMTTQKLQ